MWLIDKWSIRNFEPYKYPLGPDEYFFGTFGLLSALTSDTEDLATLMHELKVCAVRENVQYLEVIGIAPNVPADGYLGDKYKSYSEALRDYALQANSSMLYRLYTTMCTCIDNNAQAQADIDVYLASVYEIEDKCNAMDDPVVDMGVVTIRNLVCRYQGYAVRNLNPVMFFAQLYIVLKACQKDERGLLVGCNIVAAENGENSMTYYFAHMIMFSYFHKEAFSANIITLTLSRRATSIFGYVLP